MLQNKNTQYSKPQSKGPTDHPGTQGEGGHSGTLLGGSVRTGQGWAGLPPQHFHGPRPALPQGQGSSPLNSACLQRSRTSRTWPHGLRPSVPEHITSPRTDSLERREKVKRIPEFFSSRWTNFRTLSWSLHERAAKVVLPLPLF